MRKTPIAISVALTGARYSPSRYSELGKLAEHMPVSPAENLVDANLCDQEGATYFHFHARNIETGRQFASCHWYDSVANGMRVQVPDALLSFGSSRKGAEVKQAISRHGESARSIGLMARPDAFTNFADIELAAYENEGRHFTSSRLTQSCIKEFYQQTTRAMEELKIVQEVEITTLPKSFKVLESLRKEFNHKSKLHIVILLGLGQRANSCHKPQNRA